MTTGWLLLLLLLVVSSQSVDSQSTTDDETCSDGEGLVGKQQRDVYRILGSQQQQTEEHQRDIDRILHHQQQLLHTATASNGQL